MNNNRNNNSTSLVSKVTRASGLRFFLGAILIAVSVINASAQDLRAVEIGGFAQEMRRLSVIPILKEGSWACAD